MFSILATQHVILKALPFKQPMVASPFHATVSPGDGDDGDVTNMYNHWYMATAFHRMVMHCHLATSANNKSARPSACAYCASVWVDVDSTSASWWCMMHVHSTIFSQFCQ